jgi:hypothetical protein
MSRTRWDGPDRIGLSCPYRHRYALVVLEIQTIGHLKIDVGSDLKICDPRSETWTCPAGPELASRAANAAHPGDVLAARAIVDAADGGSYRFEPFEDAHLKGIPEPVPLFRVIRGT